MLPDLGLSPALGESAFTAVVDGTILRISGDLSRTEPSNFANFVTTLSSSIKTVCFANVDQSASDDVQPHILAVINKFPDPQNCGFKIRGVKPTIVNDINTWLLISADLLSSEGYHPPINHTGTFIPTHPSTQVGYELREISAPKSATRSSFYLQKFDNVNSELTLRIHSHLTPEIMQELLTNLEYTEGQLAKVTLDLSLSGFNYLLINLFRKLNTFLNDNGVFVIEIARNKGTSSQISTLFTQLRIATDNLCFTEVDP